MSHTSVRAARALSLAATVSMLLIVPEVEAQSRRVKANAAGQSGFGGGAMQRGGRMAMSGNNNYRGNRNGMGNQNNGAVASSLQGTLRLLAQADHDYQGHRALAMKHVGAAIRHLQPGGARGGQQNSAAGLMANGAGGQGGNAAAAGGAGKNRIPQATSDKQLQEALQSLNAVHGQITSAGTTPRHARAATSVQNAVRELNLALNIR